MNDKMHDEKTEGVDGVGEAGVIENGKATSKVLFKMDVRYVVSLEVFWRLLEHRLTRYRILPVLAALFLCSFIDRTNVGNAKILGLEKDIGINDHEYAIGLCVFYATYIAR